MKGALENKDTETQYSVENTIVNFKKLAYFVGIIEIRETNN